MSRNLKTASKSAPTPGARLNKKRGIVSINSALQEEWNGRLFPGERFDTRLKRTS